MPRNSGIKTGGWPERFRPGLRIMDHIFTMKQIFEKSCEYSRDIFACFVDLEKHMTEFLRINFGRFWRSTALMVSCYLPLSHSNADQRFAFG